jgi:hypothetical protein
MLLSKHISNYLKSGMERILGKYTISVRHLYKNVPKAIHNLRLTLPVGYYLQYLKGIKTLYLDSCNGDFIRATNTHITGKDLSHLSGIKKLVIDCSIYIDAHDLKHVSGVETLIIGTSSNIPYENLIYLKGIKHLRMTLESHCMHNKARTYVPYSKIKHISGIRKLYLKDAELYDNELIHLSGIEVLSLMVFRGKITDKGIKHIGGIKKLYVDGGEYITNEGLQYLTGIHTLSLRSNTFITDTGLAFISSIHTLRLPRCKNITDKGLIFISDVHELNMERNNRITNEGIKYLKDVNILYLGDVKDLLITCEHIKRIRKFIMGGTMITGNL